MNKTYTSLSKRLSQKKIKHEVIGPCLLILGDCLKVLPLLKSGSIDAVVTDPPYGIGEDGGAQRTRGSKKTNGECLGWDRERPPKIAFDTMLSLCTDAVIWGGNYFADFLPASRCWLYWEKLMGGDFADGELAWTNRDSVVKQFTKAKQTRNRIHPTQKPIEVMLWSLQFVRGQVVLDPFMGSGTTGVACIRTGRQFIGVEKEPKYFDIACSRIKAELLKPHGFLCHSKLSQNKSKPEGFIELKPKRRKRR